MKRFIRSMETRQAVSKRVMKHLPISPRFFKKVFGSVPKLVQIARENMEVLQIVDLDPKTYVIQEQRGLLGAYAFAGQRRRCSKYSPPTFWLTNLMR